jgi:hypothetical protein
MPNDELNADGSPKTSTATPSPATPATTPELEAILATRIAEALLPIKKKLDNAFAERDAARLESQQTATKLQAAEAERLRAEGKHREAAELELSETKARNTVLEAQNVELTRDMLVRQSISGIVFQNANAFEIAKTSIVGKLVKDQSGVWKGADGLSIADVVEAFKANTDNSFLFKPKVSSGGGTSSGAPTPDAGSSKSIFQMDASEIAMRARAGTLRKR